MLLLHPGGILSTWVGDSRAILAYEGEGGALTAMPLTCDHSSKDEAEIKRLVAAGGSLGVEKYAEHVYVPSAEGGLKVTRSLGACDRRERDGTDGGGWARARVASDFRSWTALDAHRPRV